MDETRAEAGEAAQEQAESTTESQAEAASRKQASAGSAWQDLEALVAELRSTNEEWSKSADALKQQVVSFGAIAAQIERHFDELAIYDSLLAIARAALNDAARLHTARLNFGLTQSAALVWYPMDDPRAELSSAPPESQYSIEVRLGPHYLLGVNETAGSASQQRLAVLIAGEKQLVATLPTTPERLRTALLRAFRAPAYSGPPRERQDEPEAATESEPTEGSDVRAADVEETLNDAGEARSRSATASEHGEQSTVEETTEQAADNDAPIELPGASASGEY